MMQSGYTVKRYSELPKTIIFDPKIAFFNWGFCRSLKSWFLWGLSGFNCPYQSLMKGRNAFWWFLPSGMDFGVSLCDLFIFVFTTLRRHWLWLREPLQYDLISSSWVTACYTQFRQIIFRIEKAKKTSRCFLGALSGMMWVMSRHVLFFRSKSITKSPRETPNLHLTRDLFFVDHDITHDGSMVLVC